MEEGEGKGGHAGGGCRYHFIARKSLSQAARAKEKETKEEKENEKEGKPSYDNDKVQIEEY